MQIRTVTFDKFRFFFAFLLCMKSILKMVSIRRIKYNIRIKQGII